MTDSEMRTSPNHVTGIISSGKQSGPDRHFGDPTRSQDSPGSQRIIMNPAP